MNSNDSLQNLLLLTDREPTLSNFIHAADEVDRIHSGTSLLQEIRVSVLRSFTFEPIIPFLKVQGAKAGFYPKIYIGPYNQLYQEVMNEKSDFYQHHPDVVFMAIRLEELDPYLSTRFASLERREITERSESVVKTVADLVSTCRDKMSAQIIIQNFSLPIYPAYGILDINQSWGQTQILREINSELVNITGSLQDAYIFDYDNLVARMGRLNWQDKKMWHVAKMPISRENMLCYADAMIQYICAIRGNSRKVLVLDLDNTLWGGIIGEVGIEGIQVGEGYPGSAFLDFQQAILNLYHRGVVLAINSKNEESVAMKALEDHPDMLLRPKHFAAMKINWRDKVENMRAIAQELNLGIDSFVFIDDNPVECGLMRSMLPEVLTLELPKEPTSFSFILESCDEFHSMGFSEEDRQRGKMYQAERQRSLLKGECNSIESFYQTLNMKLKASLNCKFSAARIAQLTQKTNQFNLTTHRYTKEQIETLMENPSTNIWSFRLIDRFGDSGIISAVIVMQETFYWEIETFLMSCRVMGRKVEMAILAYLLDQAVLAGVKCLKGCYKPTSKNVPVRDFYSNHGFKCVGTNEERKLWSLDIRQSQILPPVWCPIEVAEGDEE